jgi:hypothetical protein
MMTGMSKLEARLRIILGLSRSGDGILYIRAGGDEWAN